MLLYEAYVRGLPASRIVAAAAAVVRLAMGFIPPDETRHLEANEAIEAAIGAAITRENLRAAWEAAKRMTNDYQVAIAHAPREQTATLVKAMMASVAVSTLVGAGLFYGDLSCVMYDCAEAVKFAEGLYKETVDDHRAAASATAASVLMLD